MKWKLLGEFSAYTGCHRKEALRLLNGLPPGRARPRPAHPVRRTAYGRALMSVLKAVWEAAGHTWWVRLKGLLPLGMWRACQQRRFRFRS